MSYDRPAPPNADRSDREAIYEFWDAALSRFKAYVEAADPGSAPRHSLSDAFDESAERDDV
jgi:hypothetical protein